MDRDVHEHRWRNGLCCHCDRLGAFPSADGWVVCPEHRGL